MNVQVASTPEGARLKVRVASPTGAALFGSLGIFIGTRLVVLLLGYAAAILVPLNPSASLFTFLPFSVLDSLLGAPVSTWVRWDAFDYLTVAHTGFWLDSWTGKTSPLVSPIFPSIVHVLGGDATHGLLVSNLAFLVALVVAYTLISGVKGLSHLAARACLLLALLPYAFLLLAPYAWSLALLFAVVAFYLEEKRQPWLAAFAATFAALTHPVGIAVWLALVVGRAVRRPVGMVDLLATWPSVLLTPIGIVAAILVLRTQVGFTSPAAVAVVLGVQHSPFAAWQAALSGTSGDHVLLAFNLLLGVLALLTLPRIARLLGIAYAVYVVGIVAWGLLVSPAALGSCLLLAFPVCVAAADYLGSELTQTMAVTASVFSLAILTALFVTWHPIGGSMGMVEASSVDDLIFATFHSRLLHAHPRAARPRELLLNLDDSILFLADGAPEARYAPGQEIAIPLYLYVLNAPKHGYLLSARLTDQSGKQWSKDDKVLWTTADTSLDGIGTNQLVRNNYLQDTFDVKVDSNLPPGIYSLDVLAFNIPSFDHLKLRGVDGKTADWIEHSQIVVAASDELGTTSTLMPSHPFRADSKDGLSLLGYDVHANHAATTDLQISLFWQARLRPSHDYTVFVQLLDTSGKVVAQSDSYPLAGHFPTSQMHPGDVLRDTHDLKIPADRVSGSYRLIVGMYRLDTMQRLPFVPQNGGGAVDHLDLSTISPSALP